MIITESLRVGICQCSDIYNGRLNGQTVELLTPDSQVFTLAEVPILISRDRRRQLRNFRCHLFLDADQKEGGLQIEMDVNQLIPHPNRTDYQDSLYQGWGIRYIDPYFKLTKTWPVAVVPAVTELIDAIPELLSPLLANPNKFQLWLDQMTPPGWSVPEFNQKPSRACIIKV